MTIYRFKIEVVGIDPDQEGLEDRFYGKGVDDALICVSGGHLILAFDRDAPDEETALLSAMRDVRERGGNIKSVTWDEPRILVGDFP